MKSLPLPGLAALAALVTGCPQNDYTVELTPREDFIDWTARTPMEVLIIKVFHQMSSRRSLRFTRGAG
jgi:hypothetical protein